MKKILNTLVLFILLSNTYAQQTASGYVYNDINQNGRKDRRETGVPNVAVSNGTDVVLTDSKGFYSIPISDDNTIFVIKPAGYKTPTNEDFIPQFYYHHKPEGSPESFTYKGVSPTGKLPKSINFALYKYDEPENFSAILFGDPQPYSMDDVDYFTRKIVQNVKTKENTLFGISLGDIVGDNLTLHTPYKESMRHLQLPWYNVMGNHDMNYDATTDELSDETFERNFGSANYSFNYGKAHFIILDDILYPDPRNENKYWGGYRDDQLKFVENNLRFVDRDKLVIVAQHIDMKDDSGNYFSLSDRKRLFDLLKAYENVLILSAHTHYQDQVEYTNIHGWKGSKPLHEYNVGTTSGDWYSGIIDENGLPDATMRDGTPQGYAILNINGNKYDVDYRVAGKDADYQMSIYAPKVVPHKGRSTAQIYVNFFMGSPKDNVEYRINNGAWRKMHYTEIHDPSYLIKLAEWDFTEKLLPGRRPSNPVNCTHLWYGEIQLDLEPGTHTIEVKATDRYGKTHFGKRTYQLLKK